MEQRTGSSRQQDKQASLPWRIGQAQHIGLRGEQQDRIGTAAGFCAGNPVLLSVLADGMGGMHDGAEFSRITVECHLQWLQKALGGFSDPADVLLYLAQESNRQANKIFNETEPGGTTLVSGLFQEDRFWLLSVGDSRIYLFRQGKLLQLNREHILGPALDARAWMGAISFEDADGNLYRESITSSIGEDKIRRLDLTDNPLILLAKDKIIFMSDGIYRSLPEEELEKLLVFSPQDASDEIVRHVLEKKLPDQDNMSIIIIEYNPVEKGA